MKAFITGFAAFVLIALGGALPADASTAGGVTGTLTANKTEVQAGETVTFTAKYVNNGSSHRSNATLKFEVHDRRAEIVNSNFPGFSRGTTADKVFVMWNNVTLNKGETLIYNIDVKYADDIPAGNVIKN